MKINKVTGSILGSLTLMVMAMAPSFGQQQTFAGLNAQNSGTVNASNVFTFSGGPAGAFNTATGSAFAASSAKGVLLGGTSLTFTAGSLTALSPATGSGAAGDPFTEALSGGGFSLRDSSNNLLLSGTFDNSNILTAFNPNPGQTGSISATVANVTYTGGSFFTSSGLVNKGAFSINLTSYNPLATTTGGFLNAFQAGGGVTFSANTPTPAPEPATFVPFALGGLALFGLIVRGRKSRTFGAAA